jgi:AcrR family transcriptional regulator
MTSSGTQTERQSNTGDAILRAAVDLFAERGYRATSLKDIANVVSIRPAAVYHWFDSKESILLKLQKAFIADLTDVVTAAIARQTEPEARMAAAVREHVVFHGLNSKAAFATDSEIRALSPGNRQRIIADRDGYQDRFIELIEDGVRQGAFDVADVRIAIYAILLQCTGVALWFDPGGRCSLDEVAEVHIALVLGSLGVSGDAIARAIELARPA